MNSNHHATQEISNAVGHVFHPVVSAIISIALIIFSFSLNMIAPIPDIPIEYIHWAQFISACLGSTLAFISIIAFLKRKNNNPK